LNGPVLELAEVFRRYGKEYRSAVGEVLPLAHRRVMSDIEACRTAKLGGHVDACDRCGHTAISYNSCRNRHCPKCQGSARSKWLAAREQELLPVPYFHVVFTLPACVGDLALQNKRLLYGLLFAATHRTLLTIARDPKHLGARIGFLAVLHTWGQNLHHHPHLHCVVPGGGLSMDRSHWISSRKRFFLPVRVLSKLFRATFLAGLEAAFENRKLRLFGSLAHLADPAAFTDLLRSARAVDWVVYAKRPFGGPEHVLRYLGRYTHRVALSNNRLLAIDDARVTFRWKDYRDGNRQKVMTLAAHEFIRRFLLHVLPHRFLRIRHFGLLGNRHRSANLARCRALLSPPDCRQQSVGAPPSPTAPSDRLQQVPLVICPACRSGHMHRLSLPAVTVWDSS
jgi:putative transposase/transposase-like zinc-binding protein